jgi:hypothetical protein
MAIGGSANSSPSLWCPFVDFMKNYGLKELLEIITFNRMRWTWNSL